MKVWEYIALISKGLIDKDKDKVKNFIMQHEKNTCDIITDFFGFDLCQSRFFIKNCNNVKNCNECLEKYLDTEVPLKKATYKNFKDLFGCRFCDSYSNDRCNYFEEKVPSEQYMMPLLDTSDTDIQTEIAKVLEENAEFNEAVSDLLESSNESNKEHVIEEFYDCIQAMISVLDKIELIDLLEEGRKKHIAKLVERNWNFKRML